MLDHSRSPRPRRALPGQDRGPWRVIETREVYQNHWIRVREDSALRPDGSPGIYGVVECEPAVAVVAVGDDGRVHLVGQYRYATDAYSWEVVSGYAESGEDLLEAARRELREEAGLTASDWTRLGTAEISNSVTDQIAFIFLARGLTAADAAPDATEDLELRTVLLSEALRMAHEGEISQSVSALAIYRAWHHLNGAASDKPPNSNL